MNTPDFYLSSSEVYPWLDIAKPRCCWRVKQVQVGGRKDCFLVKIDPPLNSHAHSPSIQVLDLVIVSTKLGGFSLFPAKKWPIPVYVYASVVPMPEARDSFQPDEVKQLPWCELYQSENDILSVNRQSFEQTRFLGEETSPAGNELKVMLREAIGNASGIIRAYLASAQCGPNSMIALCMRLQGEIDSHTSDKLKTIVNTEAIRLGRLITTFLLENFQESQLSKICRPFIEYAPL